MMETTPQIGDHVVYTYRGSRGNSDYYGYITESSKKITDDGDDVFDLVMEIHYPDRGLFMFQYPLNPFIADVELLPNYDLDEID